MGTMQNAETKRSLYEQLVDLPETLTGELLNGQLHTQPRPTPRHLHAVSRLDRTIGRGYGDGVDGPGGWWILIEPEIHFVSDTEVAVPDLAGWRRDRLPSLPETAYFEIAPDWVCEILSPSTASKDREIKMPLYARHGVSHVWIVDPRAHSLEAFELRDDAWSLIQAFADDDSVAVAPFTELTIELAEFWV
jgi:Uma2 family endonuclease